MIVVELTASGRLLDEARALLAQPANTGEILISQHTLQMALNRYLAGELDAAELNEWANCLELNDRVIYEAGAEKCIATALFFLATPEINLPIDQVLCRDLLVTLAG